MSIPRNIEHYEARQMEINAERAAAKAKMTPTEVARLEVIEECSAKLEAAEVPFQLWAASSDGEPGKGFRSGWWCFHKMTYASREQFEAYTDREFESWMSMLSQLLTHQTTRGAITIVVHNSKTGKAYSVHSAGQVQYIPPPLPEVGTPPSSPI